MHAGPQPTDRSLEDFKQALRELTFNSKPIIDNLTGLAGQRVKTIPGPLSRAILDHLVSVDVRMKSPVMFLIDSILKNVGGPYLHSFVKHGLVSAIVRVLGELSLPGTSPEISRQKKDFLRVFETWKGLLHPEVLSELTAKTGQFLNEVQVAHPIPLQPETTRLLQDLRDLFINPPGMHISTIVVEIFKRLSRTELSPQILDDLEKKARLPDKRPVISAISFLLGIPDVAPIPAPMPMGGIRPPPPVPGRLPGHVPVPPMPFPGTMPMMPPPPFPPPPMPNQMMPMGPQSVPMIPPVIPPFLANINIAELAASIAAATAQKSVAPAVVPAPISVSLSPQLAFPSIPLNSADLLTVRPGLHDFLYSSLPKKCSSCGFRFPDTPEGRDRSDRHRDAHFRRNMRLKEKSKKVLARDWLADEANWIALDENKEVGNNGTGEKQVSAFFDAETSTTYNQTSPRKRDSKRSVAQSDDTDRVPIENDDEVQEKKSCALCHEPMQVEWIDDLDMWMYIGAVKNNDTDDLYHSHCAPVELRQKTLKKSKRVD